jgi:hypothetical protein
LTLEFVVQPRAATEGRPYRTFDDGRLFIYS